MVSTTLTFRTDHEAMDIAKKKLALVQRLLLIWDEAALQRVAKVIEKEAPEVDEEDDLTDEDIAELDQRHSRRLSGESKGYTAEETISWSSQGVRERSTFRSPQRRTPKGSDKQRPQASSAPACFIPNTPSRTPLRS